MKNNFKILILIIILIIVGVSVYLLSNKTKTPAEETPIVITENSIIGCYTAHLEKDIYTLVIQSEDKGVVTGILAYNNYEKDSSSGSFSGTFTNGILLGNYSFNSEGMRSDRQVIFKKTQDSFVQGFGPVKTVDGKEVFDSNQISYDSKSTFNKVNNCTEHFVNSNNVFSFDYNPFFQNIWGFEFPTKDWSLDSKYNGILLSSVIIPKTYLPNTNFSDVRLTIGRSTDVNAIKSCLNKTQDNYKEEGSTNIGGYPFKKFTFNGAAAGNFYDSVSYKGLIDGDCYAIESTIHSTNIGNYSPDQGIKEFDKARIQNEIEKIIKSFKFLISSN